MSAMKEGDAANRKSTSMTKTIAAWLTDLKTIVLVVVAVFLAGAAFNDIVTGWSNGLLLSDVKMYSLEANSKETRENKLGENRFCAISRVSNNNHSEQNCTCEVKRDGEGWVLVVINGYQNARCDCSAVCIR